ncbi:hypothetical protein HY570_01265 [Candidatus Micrarchaeota archaeon]|nr:hypothetical protein [Candidatus Micrarchaeota archaeon]
MTNMVKAQPNKGSIKSDRLSTSISIFEHALREEASLSPYGLIHNNALLEFYGRLLSYCDPAQPFKADDDSVPTNNAATGIPNVAIVKAA